MKLLTIIPAKLDSVRLAKKNLCEVDGKTLVQHAIDYAKSTQYINDIWVSTESEEVARSLPHDIKVSIRPQYLLGEAEVADVYVDFAQRVGSLEPYNYLVALQPDNLDRQHDLDFLVDFAHKKKYTDLVLVDKNGNRCGATRIIKFDLVKAGIISRRVGCVMDTQVIEIHTQEDLAVARRNKK